VHAADPGYLAIGFDRTADERFFDPDELDITPASVTGGPSGACDTINGRIDEGGYDVWCQLPAGDFTISYTLATGAAVPAWKLIATAQFQVVDYGVGNPETTKPFAVTSPLPVRERYRFFARDTKGVLWYYDGTGKATAPYREREVLDLGWNQYTAATALTPVTVHSTGDVVARDSTGTLWYFHGSANGSLFAPRTKVGTGWNQYNAIIGGRGDLTGDGHADVLARDSTGTLWLHQGTANSSAPIGGRIKVGTGWGQYNTIVGTGDITSDGRPDVVTRDASGALWLFKGTGNASAPFAKPTKVGTGWGQYNTVLAPGDLNQDGLPDVLARDAAGVLWLFKGTGNPAAPYAWPTKAGTGWKIYNTLF
jgi:hypothetical protein